MGAETRENQRGRFEPINAILRRWCSPKVLPSTTDARNNQSPPKKVQKLFLLNERKEDPRNKKGDNRKSAANKALATGQTQTPSKRSLKGSRKVKGKKKKNARREGTSKGKDSQIYASRLCRGDEQNRTHARPSSHARSAEKNPPGRAKKRRSG